MAFCRWYLGGSFWDYLSSVVVQKSINKSLLAGFDLTYTILGYCIEVLVAILAFEGFHWRANSLPNSLSTQQLLMCREGSKDRWRLILNRMLGIALFNLDPQLFGELLLDAGDDCIVIITAFSVPR